MRVFIYLALGHAVHQLPHKITHKFRSRGWYSHILFAKPRARPSPLKPAGYNVNFHGLLSITPDKGSDNT